LRQAIKFGFLGLTLALMAAFGTLAFGRGAQHATAAGNLSCSPNGGSITGKVTITCTGGGTLSSSGAIVQTGPTTFESRGPLGVGLTGQGSINGTDGSAPVVFTVGKKSAATTLQPTR
jgi:hypothetical protein